MNGIKVLALTFVLGLTGAVYAANGSTQSTIQNKTASCCADKDGGDGASCCADQQCCAGAEHCDGQSCEGQSCCDGASGHCSIESCGNGDNCGAFSKARKQ